MLLPIWEPIFNISGMLAEFSKNEEIRKSAFMTYHHIVAQLLLPWNQGLYCANPLDCKGWKNLYTGNLSTGVQIVQLTWLFYISPDERIILRGFYKQRQFRLFQLLAGLRTYCKTTPFPTSSE